MNCWQRFSDGVGDVVLLAREEACALEHDEIGVEHLLLGLLRARDASVLGQPPAEALLM